MIRQRTFFPGGGASSSIPILTGVTADGDGNVFVVSWDEAVYKLAPTGAVLASLPLPGPTGELFGDTLDSTCRSTGPGSSSAAGSGGSSRWPPTSPASPTTGPAVGNVHVAFDEPPPTLPVVPLVSVERPEAVEGDDGTTALTFTVTLCEPGRARSPCTTPPQDGTADRRRGLHEHDRHPHLRPRADDEDGHRERDRRPGRRAGRDAEPRPVRPDHRRPSRTTPAAGIIWTTTAPRSRTSPSPAPVVEGTRGVRPGHVRRHPERRPQGPGDRRLRHAGRDGHGRRRLRSP